MPKNPKIKTLTFEILEDHTDEVLQASVDQIKTALEACAIQAVGHAVTNITQMGAVDTGLLRNSITYAISGRSTALSGYNASNSSKYGKKKKKSGKYSSAAMPESENGNYVAYIGTNVEYAPYVEMGTVKNKIAKPFLRFALSQHIEEYKQIFLKYLSGT